MAPPDLPKPADVTSLSLLRPAGTARTVAQGHTSRPADLSHHNHQGELSMKAKLSIGTWAYLFNQEKPTTDFHVILHKLQDLGYEGVELGSFGPHPSPATHPTKASRAKLKKEIA